VELKDIKKLIETIDEKGITDFEMELDDFKIRIKKEAPEIITQAVQMAAPMQAQLAAPAPVAAAPAAAAAPEAAPVVEDNFHHVISPMVGTFYRAPSPDASNYASVGDQVKKGQVLCIVEAMKIMNEIQADADGVVKKIHVEDGQPVEYGEIIFSIEEN
jgi:acetyl-CoA carboxylase biotin carboxyl carrier protein